MSPTIGSPELLESPPESTWQPISCAIKAPGLLEGRAKSEMTSHVLNNGTPASRSKFKQQPISPTGGAPIDGYRLEQGNFDFDSATGTQNNFRGIIDAFIPIWFIYLHLMRHYSKLASNIVMLSNWSFTNTSIPHVFVTGVGTSNESERDNIPVR